MMSGRFDPARLSGYALIAVLIGLWEISSRTGFMDPRYVPPPSIILLHLFQLVWSGELVTQYIATFSRLIGGYLLAVVIAVPFGVLMGYYKWFYNLMSPIVEFMWP